MAVIGTIRDKGRYFLVGIVGLSLILFIAQGFFDIMGSSAPQGNLGTIDGDAVNQELYNKYVEQFVTLEQQQAQQQQKEFTDQDRANAEDRAWQATVDELTLSKEFEALGVDVSENEFTAYLYGTDGFPLLSDIQQGFTDPATGKFNAKALDKFIAEREKATDPTTVKQWKDTKEALRNQRKQEKYFQILNQGVYVTKLEAKEEYTAQKEMKSISYVVRNFREILDTDIKINDTEIREFYENNKDKKKYESTAGREVKYFDVVVAASKRDTIEFNNKMKKLTADFGRSINDSLFVLQNSDVKFYTSSHQATFRPQGDPKARQGMTYPVEMDTVFKMAKIGQIVGPYADNGKVRLAKVIDFNTKLCKVRHILINAPKGDAKKIASAKKLADSLVKIVNKTNFEEFVKKYSEDPGSKDKGGVYEDFMDYEMVAPFSDFSTTKKIGEIGVVQTDFGFHIMEVLDRKAVKYPVLALIEKTLEASDDTEMSLKDKAYNLLSKIDRSIASKEELLDKLSIFDTIAKREGFFVRPIQMSDESPRVSGFNTPLAEQKILELAWNEDAQVGDICGSPISDKGRYIIAMVSSIREKGVPTFEDAYLRMKTDAIKEKKATRFKKQIGSIRNLKVLAKKGNTIVNTADVTFANPSIASSGYEPEVIGAIFSGLKDGKTTLPLVGENGVYVIQLVKTTKAPTAANYDQEKTTLLNQYRGSIPQLARIALQKKLEVKDNRKLLEAGIGR